MPDLLILCPHPELNLELDAAARESGFRVRSTDDIAAARSWLNLRRFDLAFFHKSVEIADQERLGGLLWNKNLSARLFIFGLEDEDRLAPESRLFGAEVVRGPEAIQTLTTIVRDFKPPPPDEAQLSVMVVEDLDSARDIICIMIEVLGYSKVVGKESARAALEELHREEGRYGYVVTDIKMPDVNGAELIRTMRADEKLNHLPVVVLTACGTADWLMECMEAGASGYLLKPPKKDDLRRELGRAMRIVTHGLEPRLMKDGDAEILKRILQEKGLV